MPRLPSALVTVVVVVVWLAVPVRAGQEPSVDEVMARVNSTMRGLWATLPEFICTETITWTRMEKGKVKDERKVESTLTFVTDTAAAPGMRERREIIAVDGKPQGPKAKMPDLPIRSDFATNLLFGRFLNPSPATTYRLVPGADNSLRIEFATPPRAANSRTVSTTAGSLLIDPETMRVIEVEQHSAERDLVVTGSFQSVRIANASYWLPRAVTFETQGSFPPGALFRRNAASKQTNEFTNCRKFDVTMRMIPPTP